MNMRNAFVALAILLLPAAFGQDSLRLKHTLNTQSLLLLHPKNDSTSFKTPKYKQGFFCNFEDQLNRKKVPLDFSLGNSKY